MSLSLSLLAECMRQNPAIVTWFSIDSLSLAFRLLQCLRPNIAWITSSHMHAPHALPAVIAQFLGAVFKLPSNSAAHIIGSIWASCKDDVWASTRTAICLRSLRSKDVIDVFLQHGELEDGIGFQSLYPPVHTCLDSECTLANGGIPRCLTKVTPIKCVLFTREFGPLPVLSYSAHCRECYARYYPNYFIHDHRKWRTYYRGLSLDIQVSTHVYIEASLCDHFMSSLMCAWVSAANNAKIYNLEHLKAASAITALFPALGQHAGELTGELVLDAFFIQALIKECDEHGTLLVLNNDSDQAKRLDSALRVRNEQMVGPGQEAWSHICAKCCEVRVVNGQAQMIRAVVTDGVTVGRPCCSVHDCQGRLLSQQARFCPEHASLNEQCAIIGCDARVETGRKTCSLPAHCSLEQARTGANSALFQLKSRLERLRANAHRTGSDLVDAPLLPAGLNAVDSNDDEDHEFETAGGSNAQPRLRIRLNRTWTHNEQLCVATCGVILGRATFFGSEAVNGVRIFLHRLFPTQRSLPEVIFYDNACSLKKVLFRLGDTHFNHCAMPVDVFHMKSKHAESDEFCGRHCNPARFPDLYSNGQWRFNSSAAEMVNAWFGGFQSILREMRPDRYDFLIDEVIKQKNRFTIEEQRRRGDDPQNIDRQWLLAE